MVHCAFAAQYVLGIPARFRLLDFGDLDSGKWLDYRQFRGFPLCYGYGLEARKLRRYEKQLTKSFDYSTLTTQGELEEFKKLDVAIPSTVIPNGVDSSYFQPDPKPRNSRTIAFVGRMDYFPNIDGATYFAKDIFPLVRQRAPGAELWLVGSNPSRMVRDLGAIPGVKVTGHVADVRPYLLAVRHDILLPTIEALQALNRGESLDSRYRDQSSLLPMATTSASRTADVLERRFDRLGFGIPRCTPVGCDQERASALRTFTFGMLETVLAYSGGEADRRTYADAVANLALSVQVGDDGVVRAADRVAYRPALRGGFLSYWDRDRRYLKPTGVVQSLADRFNMPPEYVGLRPTDSETGFDAYAFLALYRCARYRVGCQLVGAVAPAP